jgi:hypothetical protein
MKTMLNIFIFYFLVTACSSSYVVSSSGEDTSVDEFNKFAEGKEVEIILIDSKVITATDLYLSADSLYWFNPETKLKNGVAKSEISKVMFTDWGLGGLEGAGFGFLSGGALGVMLVAGLEAVGSELDDSAYTDGFVSIGIVGGLIGFPIGAIIGHTNEYEFQKAEQQENSNK